MKNIFKRKSGFTLIEMIGVIAVIAILAAFVTPKVFKVIQDSKVTKLAGEIPTYTTAITNWYTDIGTIKALNDNGTLDTYEVNFENDLMSNTGTTSTTGLWANWNGSYIDSVANISLGTGFRIQTYPGTAGTGAPAANSGTAFDLNDNNANSMGGKQVVSIRLTGVPASDSLKLDSIIDKGLSVANRASSGKVKYSGTTVYIYITSL